MSGAVRNLRHRDLTAKLPQFRRWLTERGAEVLEPTNEWEVVRFRAGGDTCVIYRNKSHNLTYAGKAAEAAHAFFGGKPWRAVAAGVRRSTSPAMRTIRKRDGDDCFACGFVVSLEEESIDHLVEVTAGGPNHLSNLVLMHIVCNQASAGMSAPEKVRMHVEWKLARVAIGEVHNPVRPARGLVVQS